MSWVVSPDPTPLSAVPLFCAKSNHKQPAATRFKVMLWLLQGIGTGFRNLVVLLAGDA